MSKRSLRILCVGDSLTAGLTKGADWSTIAYHPYTTALASVLSRAFPALTIEAHVEAQPGDCVYGPESLFLQRIEPIFLTRGGGTPYDWTVILAGTNDVAASSWIGGVDGEEEQDGEQNDDNEEEEDGVDSGVNGKQHGKSKSKSSYAEAQAQKIFSALRRVWAVPLSKGGRVLACTVLETDAGGDPEDRQTATRNALNALIKSHRQENFHVFDSHAAMPYATMHPEERRRYWSDDGVHLTADGYDMLGVKIAASLISLIMPLGRLQDRPQKPQQARPKHRPGFKDDNLAFEEESGSDSLLAQGYYIVRRKDLE